MPANTLLLLTIVRRPANKSRVCKSKTNGIFLEHLQEELSPTLVYLGWLESRGEAVFGHAGWGNVALMAGLGVITAVPLLLFSAAAPRVPLTTLGLLQYITPVIQFALGVLVFDEQVSPVRLAGFVLVWFALVVFSVDALRHSRREAATAAVAAAG